MPRRPGVSRIYALSALILLFSGIWIFGLIAAPQLIMIEQSLWRMERPAGAAEISVQIDGLYNQLDVMALDRSGGLQPLLQGA